MLLRPSSLRLLNAPTLGTVVQFKRFEPRGKHFYQDGGGKGPDLEALINGERKLINVPAIADDADAHRKAFHAAKLAASQTKIQLVRTSSVGGQEVSKRLKESPLDKRDRTKMNSRDAQTS